MKSKKKTSLRRRRKLSKENLKKIESFRKALDDIVYYGGDPKALLADFISEVPLMPEVLLSRISPARATSTLLEVLTKWGLLSEIPSAALTPRVVLSFSRESEDETHYNFLAFCAFQGCYSLLPERYQTRTAILHHNRRLPPQSSPFIAAFYGAKFRDLPYHTLKRGDILDWIEGFFYAGEIESIKHLVTPEDITAEVVAACFQNGRPVPDMVIKNLTTEKMLQSNGFQTPLYDAVVKGTISQVPTNLFIDFYRKAKDSFDPGIEHLTKCINQGSLLRDKQIVSKNLAEKWMLKLSNEVLKKAGSALRKRD